MPVGGDDQARAFFADLLGLTEIPKPTPSLGGGGCWSSKLGECEISEAVPFGERQRLFSSDPFGNRLEFVED